MFGAKLAMRLVLLFSLLTILPGALIYTISVQFLTKSIETWFDVRVDKAPRPGGLNLGRLALHNELSGWRRAGQASHRLAMASNARLRRRAAADAHGSGSGRSDPVQPQRLLAPAAGPLMRPALLLDASIQRELLDLRHYTTPIESLPHGGLALRAVAEMPLGDGQYYLQLVQRVPKTLSEDAGVGGRVRGIPAPVAVPRRAESHLRTDAYRCRCCWRC